AVFLPIADGDLEAVFLSHLHPRWLVDGGLAAGLIALCWFVGAKVFQPLVAGSVKRSLDFHVHPNRGRIADAVRSLVASDQVAGELRRGAESTKRMLRRRVRAGVLDVVKDLIVRLETRRAEVEWLNRQLGDYLSLEGVDTSKTPPAFLSNRSKGDVR